MIAKSIINLNLTLRFSWRKKKIAITPVRIRLIPMYRVRDASATATEKMIKEVQSFFSRNFPRYRRKTRVKKINKVSDHAMVAISSKIGENTIMAPPKSAKTADEFKCLLRSNPEKYIISPKRIALIIGAVAKGSKLKTMAGIDKSIG